MKKRADVPDRARDDDRRRQPSGTRRKVVDLDPRALAEPRRRLVVIGNGMVSQHFCRRAVELGLPRTHHIVVFGEEAMPAYNRVELTSVLGGRDPASLILEPARWYAESDIELRLGERVIAVDRAQRRVTTQLGDVQTYDALVFATGSYAATPVIPGTNQHGVFAYRTLEDAQRIHARARALARERARVVVIGSGLLGIEAGQAIAELGCDVTLVEAAPQLLPRQLDLASAGIVADMLRGAGFDLRLGQVVQRIVLTSEVRPPHLVRAARKGTGDVPDTRLCVVLAGSDGPRAIECGMVVLASGVKPRDELGRASGLACPPPGGIAVDSALMTSDPRVFAIGECARHAGRCSGLVAPGYAMADVLAERLAGRNSSYAGHEPTTRLRVGRRPILVLGESRALGAGAQALVSREPYRRLVVRGGRLIGATAIGEGDDLSGLWEAIVMRRQLRPRDLRLLQRGEDPWRGQRLTSEAWPDTATACDCTGVTFGALRRARAEGCQTLAALCARTGAGGGCGSCRPRLAAFVSDAGAPAPARGELGLGLASFAALIAVGLGAAWAPLPQPLSVREPHALALLWSSPLARQLSGYALALLALLSAVAIAVSKRRARRSSSGSPPSRAAHAALGLACLAGIAAHTGLRWGSGLDRALSICLLSLIVVGAASALSLGVAPSLPATASGFGRAAHALRRFGLRLHVWIAWPAPVLLAIHIVKSYYF